MVKKIFLASLLILLPLIVFPSILKAQWCGIYPDTGVRTALGCLQADEPLLLFTQVLQWAVGIAGTVAFVTFIFAGSMYITSGGDPKRVKAAQELIVSAISGLFLIALSVILLNFIGVNILDLGGLGFDL